ncbi:MAG TPA: FHA domain-containing protein [Thermoanaerobaculia bacterium]|nr:FHA domain-containing protein [Thermoanaerobaculia bacterium]
MPLIRCAKCGQAYDVPGPIAVHLPNSIAMCDCGEWLAGSKAAVLARLLNPDEIKEIDLKPYKVDAAAEAQPPAPKVPLVAPGKPRSIRVIARSGGKSINRVFTIGQHPLWIGRKGCHIDLDEADLDIRHCSITLQGDQLVVRDADSHMGTFLDGQRIAEAPLGDGVHVLRAGAALVSIEPTDEEGMPVQPTRLRTTEMMDESMLAKKIAAREQEADGPKRNILVCIDGPLSGQEFEIPPGGLVVGREGHVRVPDEFLSRKHFEVAPDPEGHIRVRDLGSRNGTFLNTLPAQNTKVHSGDEIRAGNNRFRIEQRA